MQTIQFPFGFGDELEDVVSGFRGAVVAMTQWLNGCQRISIQPRGLDKDNKMQEIQTIDAQQLRLVQARAVVLPEPPAIPAPTASPAPPPRRTGGPFPRPTRATAPR